MNVARILKLLRDAPHIWEAQVVVLENGQRGLMLSNQHISLLRLPVLESPSLKFFVAYDGFEGKASEREGAALEAGVRQWFEWRVALNSKDLVPHVTAAEIEARVERLQTEKAR